MSEWMGRGTQSTPCVCGVSSAICVCVGGWVWGQERGERRQAWTAWEVGVVVRRQAQRHTSVRATTVRRCAQSHHHTHTHSGQGGAAHTVVVVGGNGAQWWWQPHHTQPPPPRASHALCVCDGSGQHQHSQ